MGAVGRNQRVGRDSYYGRLDNTDYYSFVNLMRAAYGNTIIPDCGRRYRMVLFG